MKISKKKLVGLIALVSILCVTLTYAVTVYVRNVPTTFTIVSSYNLGVVDAVSGANWTQWDIGSVHRGDFPISSGIKNVTWLGDAPNGIYLSWNSSGFDPSVTVTAEYNNAGTWTEFTDNGSGMHLPMGEVYQMWQIRFTISVLSTIPDGSYSGTINLNADPK
jgi:hypothetical protein